MQPRTRLRLLATAALAAALAVPAGAVAGGSKHRDRDRAYVPDALAQAAVAQPTQSFRVIVQGAAAAAGVERRSGRVERRLASIDAVAATVSGAELQALAADPGVEAVTVDAPMVAVGRASRQIWPEVTGLSLLWPRGRRSAPAATIAIVDSGIDATLPDFAGRVREQVTLTSLQPNSPGDGRGHGTFVAGLAAGAGKGRTGAAPTADIVSLDVMDDTGKALTSDVVAAAEWILANKDRLSIRVANFSLVGTVPASVFWDPLDRAVEKLWLGGVTVVAAAGNYAEGGRPSGVLFAPANDPFVITVGAVDTGTSVSTRDDVAAPWSAYGYTLDGFAKPELGAPGRFIDGVVPNGSTMAKERPDRVVYPGTMEMSGTSFAAPIVAGAAAVLLGRHPDWTPGQVKGALMLTARQGRFAPLSAGVGELDAAAAAALEDAPDANAALAPFVVGDPQGGPTPVFDAASWASAALASASWASASWASASWASASWASASWASASWASASWASASWASASWASASWASASWASASWASASWASASWASASWAAQAWVD